MLATPLTYRDRIEMLHKTKLEQTDRKIKKYGYMDSDDHGMLAQPEDFRFEPKSNHASGGFFGARAFGQNFRALMEAHPVYVNPVDGLAGRQMTCFGRYRKVAWCPDFDYSDLHADQKRYDIASGIGAGQHFGPDLKMGLDLGFGGLLKKVRHYRTQHGPDKADFYDAWEDILLGLRNWMTRTIAAIGQAQASESRPELRENLQEMAQANQWILDNPPRTLREACQWLAWYMIASRMYNGDGAGGRIDELLRPYYEADMAAGTMDDEKAIYLIASLLLSDTHYHQLGGPGPDGRDLTSKVSYLVLEAAHRLGIAANLTVRVHDKMDPDFFMKAVTHLVEDRKGWPRFSGDKGLTEGFARNGYSMELARERIAVGCHWMALPGTEYSLNDCVKISAAKVFETALWDMLQHSAQPGTAELWRLFEQHLRQAVLCTAKGIDFQLAHQWKNAPELMLDLLCHGPVEKGLDASNGGVEYYNMCVDGCGLATVADSFAALEQRIERDKVLTWDQIARHLKENFEGEDGQRVRLMMKTAPHYGQGNSLGDACAKRLSRLFTDLVREKPTPGGRIMIPGWFSWSNTMPMGKVIGATPNGRLAAAPISHGANPDPGFRKDGAATAMVNAIAEIQCGYGNTCPVQMELDPAVPNHQGGVEKVASLIRTHFDMGGTLFNINVLDKDTLLEAHKDPSRYPDLVVRVTGFTAYFAALSPAFRQLVVDRVLSE